MEQSILKQKMNIYAREIYRASLNFPRSEMYGITSQIRRSGLSVILNYIEGFARLRHRTQIHFYEISYGSLQESKYLLEFSYDLKYLTHDDYKRIIGLADEIGAMLWTTIKSKKTSSVI